MTAFYEIVGSRVNLKLPKFVIPKTKKSFPRRRLFKDKRSYVEQLLEPEPQERVEEFE